MELLPIVLGVIGGLALFLYGLRALSDGLKRFAGEKLKALLEKLTNKPLKGCFVGAFISAVLQSSSITMVTLIGLINAGLLNLRQGIGIMLGSEIGTTITAQLVAFKIGVYYLPIIAFGFFVSALTKDRRYKSIGQTIFGFGIIFLGMSIMSSSIIPLQSEPSFENLLIIFGKIPILGVVIGALFTGILQSSSAVTSLVISVGMHELITLEASIAIIFGTNLGTCITGFLASLGSSLSSKRLALAQLLVNILGVSLFFPFLSNFVGLVITTSPDLPRQIANAHTIFNIIVTALILPLTGFLATIVERVLPGAERKIENGIAFLDKKLLSTPSIALSQADNEIVRLAEMTYNMLNAGTQAILRGDTKLIEEVLETEKVVDELHETIHQFLDDIPAENLSERELRRLAYLTHTINDVERIGDHANNLVEIAEKILKIKTKEGVTFSKLAMKELTIMCQKTNLAYRTAITVLREGTKELIQTVLDLEAEIDDLQRAFEANHARRLKEGKCNPVLGMLFIDSLRNLERIADHSNNITKSVQLGF